MDVALVSPTHFSDESQIGGAERYATELAHALSKKATVRWISFGRRSRHVRLSDSLSLQVCRSWLLQRSHPDNPLNLRFVRRLQGTDVLHCIQPASLVCSFALLAGRLTGSKVFTTEAGGGTVSLHRMLDLDRWVDASLAISEFAARAYPSRRVRVVHGGANPDRFFPKGEGERVGFLYVGRVACHKGLDVLIRALPSGTGLDVVGPGADGGEYHQILLELAAGKDVRFSSLPVGPSLAESDAALAERYSRALATVLPSVYVDVLGHVHPVTELLGLVLLESQACGTPVICTEVGGMPEVVEDGKTGFVVPPNDPQALRERMEYFLENPGEVERMGRRGRERLRREFSWDAVATRCLEAYRET